MQRKEGPKACSKPLGPGAEAILELDITCARVHHAGEKRHRFRGRALSRGHYTGHAIEAGIGQYAIQCRR